MIDFTKWSVEEMRAELVKLTGLSPESALSVKGKSNLAEAIIVARKNAGLDVDDDKVGRFDAVELESNSLIATNDTDVVSTEGEQKQQQVVIQPKMGSPAWQEFVLGHLLPEEFQEKNGKKFPKAAGLRRIAQILCGPIMSSGPINVFASHGPDSTVSVVYEVQIYWTRDVGTANQWMSEKEIMSLNLPIRKFSEVADCNKLNTPAPYNAHPSATASSKAEGRTFKKLLMLNIHTAEEMGDLTDEPRVSEVSTMNSDNEAISPQQTVMIQKKSEQLSIDVEKFLQYHKFKSDISALTRSEGAAAIVLLNKYQTETGASLDIPSYIKSN